MGEPNGHLEGFSSVSKEQSELYMAESEADLDESKEAETEVETETSRLLELANTIQAQVTQIQKYLTETKQPNPRFEATEPLIDWEGIDDTRSDCIENLAQLTDLLMTPREALHSQAVIINLYISKTAEEPNPYSSPPTWLQDMQLTVSESTAPSLWKAHEAMKT